MDIPFPLTPRAKRSGAGWVDLCPAHDDREPSLSIRVSGDGRLLLFCHAGCEFRDILAAAGLSRHSIPKVSPTVRQELVAREEALNTANKARALHMWNEGGPISGTLGEVYLRSRAIMIWGEDQRFHPRLWHRETASELPCILSPIVREDRFVAVHRIFLTPDARKVDHLMLGKCKGGAVRLGGAGARLVVGEGVETTLALWQMCAGQEGMFWAATSADKMSNLILPREPGELVVGADGEPKGRKAAHDLCARAVRLGWRASVIDVPDGKDFNDLLMARARDGH
jgi:hypothetical protein